MTNRTIGIPSVALLKHAARLAEISGPVLDVPCGYGRNAIWLTTFGLDVLCADVDRDALEAIDTYQKSIDDISRLGSLTTVHCDLLSLPWTFPAEEFSLIVNVDFVALELFKHFTFSLRQGGLLNFETFGNRGANYLQLPRAQQAKRLLANNFEFDMYDEKKAGPSDIDAVTVRCLARKK